MNFKVFRVWLLMGFFLPLVAFGQQRNTEGMWIPMNVKDMNYSDMKKAGFALGPDDVYNTDNQSLKDVVVRLNGGSCTAEVISGSGLLLTNHHCAYDAVASLSSVKSDFLTDGFWAKSFKEELPIPGAFVSFLVRMENVTEQVLGKDKSVSDPTEIEQRKAQIIAKAEEGNDYSVEVKEYFAGSEYYMLVYENFRDIRLVGAPPSSIGKYGGDTDNWMWPRHTGDFSLLRVYASKDNHATGEYSEENVPYKPKKFLALSLDGVKEGDYAMVMGYPGSTDRYLTSDQIKFALDQTNGDRYHLMDQKLKIWKKYMDKNDTIRIALASDYASLANYWKYIEGQTTMLKRYDIVGVKKKEEDEFKKWAMDKAEYKNVLSDIAGLHNGYNNVDKFVSYLNFGLFGAQASIIASNFMRLQMAMEADPTSGTKAAEKAKPRVEEQFASLFPRVDKDVMTATLLSFYNDIPKDMHPKELTDILTSKVTKKGKTVEEKFRMWVDNAYKVSVTTDKKRAMALLAKPDLKVLQADPIVSLVTGIVKSFRSTVAPKYAAFEGAMSGLAKTYIKGLREMHPDKKFYPDANSTMRVTYGKVAAYRPKDAMFYDYYTTFDGVIEKEDNTSDEFTVPKKLHQLWEQKDYGRYALPNGQLPVCFLTTNDITGGNSGSPVMNAKGELIGCAFDGNWEAMAGDIHVFPNLNRTICVDIRYVLFIIEKYAGANNIINELDIRKGKSSGQD